VKKKKAEHAKRAAVMAEKKAKETGAKAKAAAAAVTKKLAAQARVAARAKAAEMSGKAAAARKAAAVAKAAAGERRRKAALAAKKAARAKLAAYEKAAAKATAKAKAVAQRFAAERRQKAERSSKHKAARVAAKVKKAAAAKALADKQAAAARAAAARAVVEKMAAEKAARLAKTLFVQAHAVKKMKAGLERNPRTLRMVKTAEKAWGMPKGPKRLAAIESVVAAAQKLDAKRKEAEADVAIQATRENGHKIALELALAKKKAADADAKAAKAHAEAKSANEKLAKDRTKREKVKAERAAKKASVAKAQELAAKKRVEKKNKADKAAATAQRNADRAKAAFLERQVKSQKEARKHALLKRKLASALAAQNTVNEQKKLIEKATKASMLKRGNKKRTVQLVNAAKKLDARIAEDSPRVKLYKKLAEKEGKTAAKKKEAANKFLFKQKDAEKIAAEKAAKAVAVAQAAADKAAADKKAVLTKRQADAQRKAAAENGEAASKAGVLKEKAAKALTNKTLIKERADKKERSVKHITEGQQKAQKKQQVVKKAAAEKARLARVKHEEKQAKIARERDAKAAMVKKQADVKLAKMKAKAAAVVELVNKAKVRTETASKSIRRAKRHKERAAKKAKKAAKARSLARKEATAKNSQHRRRRRFVPTAAKQIRKDRKKLTKLAKQVQRMPPGKYKKYAKKVLVATSKRVDKESRALSFVVACKRSEQRLFKAAKKMHDLKPGLKKRRAVKALLKATQRHGKREKRAYQRAAYRKWRATRGKVAAIQRVVAAIKAAKPKKTSPPTPRPTPSPTLPDNIQKRMNGLATDRAKLVKRAGQMSKLKPGAAKSKATATVLRAASRIDKAGKILNAVAKQLTRNGAQKNYEKKMATAVTKEKKAFHLALANVHKAKASQPSRVAKRASETSQQLARRLAKDRRNIISKATQLAKLRGAKVDKKVGKKQLIKASRRLDRVGKVLKREKQLARVKRLLKRKAKAVARMKAGVSKTVAKLQVVKGAKALATQKAAARRQAAKKLQKERKSLHKAFTTVHDALAGKRVPTRAPTPPPSRAPTPSPAPKPVKVQVPRLDSPSVRPALVKREKRLVTDAQSVNALPAGAAQSLAKKELIAAAELLENADHAARAVDEITTQQPLLQATALQIEAMVDHTPAQNQMIKEFRVTAKDLTSQLARATQKQGEVLGVARSAEKKAFKASAAAKEGVVKKAKAETAKAVAEKVAKFQAKESTTKGRKAEIKAKANANKKVATKARAAVKPTATKSDGNDAAAADKASKELIGKQQSLVTHQQQTNAKSANAKVQQLHAYIAARKFRGLAKTAVEKQASAEVDLKALRVRKAAASQAASRAVKDVVATNAAIAKAESELTKDMSASIAAAQASQKANAQNRVAGGSHKEAEVKMASVLKQSQGDARQAMIGKATAKAAAIKARVAKLEEATALRAKGLAAVAVADAHGENERATDSMAALVKDRAVAEQGVSTAKAFAKMKGNKATAAEKGVFTNAVARLASVKGRITRAKKADRDTARDASAALTRAKAAWAGKKAVAGATQQHAEVLATAQLAAAKKAINSAGRLASLRKKMAATDPIATAQAAKSAAAAKLSDSRKVSRAEAAVLTSRMKLIRAQNLQASSEREVATVSAQIAGAEAETRNHVINTQVRRGDSHLADQASQQADKKVGFLRAAVKKVTEKLATFHAMVTGMPASAAKATVMKKGAEQKKAETKDDWPATTAAST